MPPLINNYFSKHVFEKDSKPCVVCYRSTTHVLIVDSKLDHLYVCQSHMKDAGFATPLLNHPDHDSYNRIKDRIHELTDEAATLSKQISDSKPPIWSSLWDSSKKARLEGGNGPAIKPPPIPSLSQLKQLLAQAELKLSHKEDELASYQFQRFELDKGIFTSRVLAKRSADKIREREKHLRARISFPKAPSGKIE